MNFLEAVEQMRQGKKVRRNQHDNTLPWVYSNGALYIIEKNGNRKIGHLCMSHFEASDWEVVEEPKKTLWDKVCEYDEDDKLLSVVNVRKALKEFLNQFNVLKNTNEDLDKIRHSVIINKAKEIFGEELLKMSSFEKALDKAKYTLLQDVSTIKEVFIIDELQAYMDLSDTANPKWVQPVRVRLQEKNDWEQRVREAIIRHYEFGYDKILKELGLEDEKE